MQRCGIEIYRDGSGGQLNVGPVRGGYVLNQQARDQADQQRQQIRRSWGARVFESQGWVVATAVTRICKTSRRGVYAITDMILYIKRLPRLTPGLRYRRILSLVADSLAPVISSITIVICTLSALAFVRSARSTNHGGYQ
ncbi:hypothetical protein P153DRAFT_188180 [Dothidotthia symphoricarpi CBS 119687]|uniref:Uncharacterized protein n=1 Tax=Dothidotthia symphoricarpi CBS 119687 TaxID=1392245 RepID=A0A6A6AMG9_9PLEO|nr:uncharacterized protein P153DRAFT_188180 [Dothidotthia symphoricarpi CBS 119687]KAF2132285.1 hypothetical protein P153DRAFT_188180 [Dothidotthia symphoricarpi CBS 119687]